MINKLKAHIKINFNYLQNKNILVGLSGGLDSIVLAYVLNKLEYKITLAHVNFNLRGAESDKDEDFVKNWAKENKLKLHTISFDTESYAKKNKVSIEMAARDLRYNWFYSLLKEENLDYIAVAHHLNDNIETVLLNLSRGTGIAGITGMKDIYNKTIRPLLTISRYEIEQFAEKEKLAWREDLSNKDISFRRNLIRHKLMPVFQELNPSFTESFKRNISNFKDTEEVNNEFLSNVDYSFWIEKESEIRINIKKLSNIKGYKIILREKLLPFRYNDISDILDSFNSVSGKIFHSKTHRIVKDRDDLILTKTHTKDYKIKESYSIDKDVKHVITPISLNLSIINNNEDISSREIAQLDLSKLKFPLKIRKWENGDFFYPLGMKGKKKMSKYFKDEKYSLVDKENQWLLTSNNNIVWVIGKRLDDRFKVSTNTKEILKIKKL